MSSLTTASVSSRVQGGMQSYFSVQAHRGRRQHHCCIRGSVQPQSQCGIQCGAQHSPVRCNLQVVSRRGDHGGYLSAMSRVVSRSESRVVSRSASISASSSVSRWYPSRRPGGVSRRRQRGVRNAMMIAAAISVVSQRGHARQGGIGVQAQDGFHGVQPQLALRPVILQRPGSARAMHSPLQCPASRVVSNAVFQCCAQPPGWHQRGV